MWMSSGRIYSWRIECFNIKKWLFHSWANKPEKEKRKIFGRENPAYVQWILNVHNYYSYYSGKMGKTHTHTHATSQSKHAHVISLATVVPLILSLMIRLNGRVGCILHTLTQDITFFLNIIHPKFAFSTCDNFLLSIWTNAKLFENEKYWKTIECIKAWTNSSEYTCLN